MFSPSSALCFVQGAPLRSCGYLRSVEFLGRSLRLPRPLSLPRANLRSCMPRTQHYYGTEGMDPLTVDDYHALIETGRLDDRRVELLNGLLITMHPQSIEHIAAVSILFKRLFIALEIEKRAVVRKADPITLTKSNSEPEPDVVIMSGLEEDYDRRKPVSSDILLVVEVSRSTIVKDSTVKLRDYASEGIPEYWIVDIRKRNVQVFRKPQGNSYESKETFSSSFIAPAAFSDVRIRVKDLFRS